MGRTKFTFPGSQIDKEVFIERMAELSTRKGWEGDYDEAADWSYADQECTALLVQQHVLDDEDFRQLAWIHKLVRQNNKHPNWMSVYDDGSFGKIEDLVGQAQLMVSHDAHVSGKFRDEGSCVIGAGIAIDFRAYRKRNGDTRVIVQAPFQGNVGSYRACERAMRYLQENGVNCYWHDGRMD